ncbi:carbohydrate binding domain-containing protein [bacterium]|nr:carbohydrate binding domain-containing protein [bacterium]
MQWARRTSGFTIVELLIVVVVIAILAAITIVAYNGITQRANAAAAQSGVEQAVKKVSTYAITNGDLNPPDLTTAGVTSSGNTTYQYSVDNTSTPAGYCVTAFTNGISYYAGSNYNYTGASSGTVNQLTPISGACPGHTGGTPVNITNYSKNPGIEVDVSNLNGANSTTYVRDTSKAHSGSASLLLTMPTQATTYVVGATLATGSDYQAAFGLAPNTTYNVSAWVYVPSSTVDISLLIQGSGKTLPNPLPASRATSVKNQWVRLDEYFTTTATTGGLNIFATNVTGTTSGMQFWVDDVMITPGVSPQASYADGSSPGWSWNGLSGRSSSTGPSTF